MAQAAQMISSETDNDFPFAKTEATKMLSKALDTANEEKGWSQRQVAKLLNYKTSVVLSHMAAGRVPIPVDRALDFARLLKMDAGAFLMAVLQQRHPEIDFPRILSGVTKKAPAKAASSSYVVGELESLAGMELDELPQQTVEILRDVVTDRNAPRRWMGLGDVALVEEVRKAHPHGLSPAQRKAFVEAINGL